MFKCEVRLIKRPSNEPWTISVWHRAKVPRTETRTTNYSFLLSRRLSSSMSIVWVFVCLFFCGQSLSRWLVRVCNQSIFSRSICLLFFFWSFTVFLFYAELCEQRCQGFNGPCGLFTAKHNWYTRQTAATKRHCERTRVFRLFFAVDDSEKTRWKNKNKRSILSLSHIASGSRRHQNTEILSEMCQRMINYVCTMKNDVIRSFNIWSSVRILFRNCFFFWGGSILDSSSHMVPSSH